MLCSQGPPIIHELYKFESGRQTFVGDYVHISCVVSGLPRPQVTWLKFGSGYFYYKNYYYYYNNNQFVVSGLFCDPAKLSYSGNYTCLAQNRNGIAKSNITLIVHGTLYIHTYRYVIYIVHSVCDLKILHLPITSSISAAYYSYNDLYLQISP